MVYVVFEPLSGKIAPAESERYFQFNASNLCNEKMKTLKVKFNRNFLSMKKCDNLRLKEE